MKKKYSFMLASLLISSAVLGSVPVLAAEYGESCQATEEVTPLQVETASPMSEANSAAVASGEAEISPETTEETANVVPVNAPDNLETLLDEADITSPQATAEDSVTDVQLSQENTEPALYPDSNLRSNEVVRMVDAGARAVADNVTAGEANRPRADFIDVSSHNGTISVEDYRIMREKYGVRGVVVKVSEGTSYTNPYAGSQINNAISAGMVVSTYHYTHYTNPSEAAAEANYYASVAESLGVSKRAVMVADIEEGGQNIDAINDATEAFRSTLVKRGYSNVAYYLSRNRTDLGGGKFNTLRFGRQNCWIAQYPYTPTASQNYNSNTAAWQWGSTFYFPHISRRFDINMDYTGLFTTSGEYDGVTPVKGSVKVEDTTGEKATFKVTANISAGGYTPKEVEVAFWPEGAADNQKKWFTATYEGSNNWTTTLNVSDFGKSGKYNVHVYARMTNTSSKMTAIGVSSFNVPAPTLTGASATVSAYDAENGTYQITLNAGTTKGIEKVQVNVWSEGETIDKGIYTATRQSDGTYKATVNVKNHLYNIGSYSGVVKVYTEKSAAIPAEVSVPAVNVTDVPLAEVQLYRAYNPNSGEHLYTANSAEKKMLVALGWKDEGNAWKASSKGSKVYRLYNPNTGEHFYTSSSAEYEAVAKKGWKKEGKAFSSPATKEKAVYRLFNPNAKGAGSHHYTTSSAERDKLVKLGWKNENIAFYGE